ncbi:MAG: hypothetical protein RL338_11 [Chloroflexota bacterium]
MSESTERDQQQSRLPVQAHKVRDAVLHLLGEQPLLCDLLAVPNASDSAIVCTNLRTKSGTRPVFIDATDSLFVFPYGQVRFIELPTEAPPPRREAGEESAPPPPPEPELEIDEDLLRRVREA